MGKGKLNRRLALLDDVLDLEVFILLNDRVPVEHFEHLLIVSHHHR